MVTRPHARHPHRAPADIDHDFWGRPEQMTTARPIYVYDSSTPAADLMGKVAAALASSSLVFRTVDPTFAANLLTHARDLYAWGAEKDGECAAPARFS